MKTNIFIIPKLTIITILFLISCTDDGLYFKNLFLNRVQYFDSEGNHECALVNSDDLKVKIIYPQNTAGNGIDQYKLFTILKIANNKQLKINKLFFELSTTNGQILSDYINYADRISNTHFESTRISNNFITEFVNNSNYSQIWYFHPYKTTKNDRLKLSLFLNAEGNEFKKSIQLKKESSFGINIW